MSVHVRPCLLIDREYVSPLVTRFSEFALPDWRSADEINRTNWLSLQKALEEPELGAAILVAEDETQGLWDSSIFKLKWTISVVENTDISPTWP